MSSPLAYAATMNADIQKFLALQTALINEKAKLEARLNEISKVLDGDSVAAPSPAAPATTTTSGKRTFSAATKAKMKASQQARWAKKKGVVESAVAPVSKTGKRTMSEATKAKMRAAHQARWSKLKGKTGSSPAPAPAAKKTKRVISPEAKARMVAGAKKRWAKVAAAKTKTAK